jgi:hemoglobin
MQRATLAMQRATLAMQRATLAMQRAGGWAGRFWTSGGPEFNLSVQIGVNTEEAPMSASLYDRLGGEAGIAAIVNDVIGAHLANPAVQARFLNVSDIEHAKKMATQFFCAGSGGPQAYTGKDMRTAHKGMNISEQEYLAVVDDIMGALDKHRIDEATRKDVLAILYSLKGEIIRV